MIKIFVMLGVLCLVGCAKLTAIDPNQYHQTFQHLEVGAQSATAIALMGTPDDSQEVVLMGVSGKHLIWKSLLTGKTYRATFIADRLISKTEL